MSSLFDICGFTAPYLADMSLSQVACNFASLEGRELLLKLPATGFPKCRAQTGGASTEFGSPEIGCMKDGIRLESSRHEGII